MMRTRVFRASMMLDVPRPDVFAFFSEAANLGRLTPPAMAFRIVTPAPIRMRPGTLIDYTLRLHGVPLRWRSEITQWEPPSEFVDTQLRGPYAHWVHIHRFREQGGMTIIEDEVRYALPFGMLGRIAHPLVRRRLTRIFEYRRAALERILLGNAAYGEVRHSIRGRSSSRIQGRSGRARRGGSRPAA
jgi:ligand-binding SRPBCC domain-containing protein